MELLTGEISQRSEFQGKQFQFVKPDAPVFQEQSRYLLLYPQLAQSPEMSPDLPLLGRHYFHERSTDIEFLPQRHRNRILRRNKYITSGIFLFFPPLANMGWKKTN